MIYLGDRCQLIGFIGVGRLEILITVLLFQDAQFFDFSIISLFKLIVKFCMYNLRLNFKLNLRLNFKLNFKMFNVSSIDSLEFILSAHLNCDNIL